MTLGVEREGLAEPLRDFVRSGKPVARHLRGADHARPRPPGLLDVSAAAQRLRAPAPARSRPTSTSTVGPLRAVFIRAPWIESLRRRRRGARRARRPPGGGAAVEHPRRGVPPRADRRPPRCTAGSSRPTEARPNERPARGGARPDPRPLLDPSQKGDVCVIQSTTRRRGARAGRLRGGAARGRAPDHPAHHGGRAGRLLRAGVRRPSSTGSPPTPSGSPRTPTSASRSWPTSTRASFQRATPRKQARAQKARKPLMETTMRRAAAGDHRWALTLFPTQAYARRGGHVAARVRGLLLRGLPGRRRRARHGLERQSDEVNRLAEWITGRSEVRIQAPGHRPHARRGGPHLDPLHGRAQHARRRVLHRPGRGLGQRRGGLLVPGRIRRPRGGGRAVPLRGRQGRGRVGRAAARTS